MGNESRNFVSCCDAFQGNMVTPARRDIDGIHSVCNFDGKCVIVHAILQASALLQVSSGHQSVPR